MRKLSVGDIVIATLFSGREVTSKVKRIEICYLGSKIGRAVNSCNMDIHSNGTIDLECGNWCYFEQVKSINKG